ncbi:FKBP-type peptidyl-prolyl cis-trans isomerase [Desulfoplanes formicivorans]|uniref:Peptidyl-prolyl cis-trans isomerase n=1 Tax=Desulfoplanes formicivorans TaxID=1592317 RepID=A0A194AHP1_9BACT|nr:FKBP-type peptidyl-prolyl cis-trans isomerase [Desulfoplanes formicivorans]GAU08289.1 membrane protein [Desulfoplanes formicivorans]
MKKTLLTLVCLLALTVACNQENEKAATSKASQTLTTQQDKVSYSIGMDIGTTIKQQGFDVDPALVALGINHAFTNATTLLTPEQAKEVLAQWQQDMMQKRVEAIKKQAEENAAAGKAFLEANAKKEGVVTLDSGLQYKILEEGNGTRPAVDDIVTVHYKGTLTNGTEFDSTYSRNQPATFPVNGVIKGWTEALQKMKTGGHWMLYIPANLAYGERQAGPIIGPNSTLVFDVTLLSIQDKNQAGAAQTTK